MIYYKNVDDINIASTEEDLVAAAYVRLKELLLSKEICLAPQKCVWFSGLNNIRLPESLANEGVQIAEKAVKTLGAYVGEPRIPESLQCPGCRTLLDSSSAFSHIAGCVQCSGNNTTMKHNNLVRIIYELCMKAGVPCEREPRQFTSYKCSTCGESFPQWRKSDHQKVCRNASLHRSGPDIVIHWATGEIFYDLTIIHELAPTNARKRSGTLMREAITRKHSTYVASGMIPQERFVCLPVLSGGAMHHGLRHLLHTLADCSGLDRVRTLNEFSLCLQELNGSIVFSQLRNYLSNDDSQNMGL